MYGKFFSRTFSNSMAGAGPEVFAVWGYAIASSNKSRVEIDPEYLAFIIGKTSAEAMQKAVDYLAAPDPASTNREHDGRRLVHEGGIQYFMPSWEHYHSIKNADDLLEYNKLAKRKQRERDKEAEKSSGKKVEKPKKPGKSKPAEPDNPPEQEPVNPPDDEHDKNPFSEDNGGVS